MYLLKVQSKNRTKNRTMIVQKLIVQKKIFFKACRTMYMRSFYMLHYLQYSQNQTREEAQWPSVNRRQTIMVPRLQVMFLLVR